MVKLLTPLPTGSWIHKLYVCSSCRQAKHAVRGLGSQSSCSSMLVCKRAQAIWYATLEAPAVKTTKGTLNTSDGKCAEVDFTSLPLQPTSPWRLWFAEIWLEISLLVAPSWEMLSKQCSLAPYGKSWPGQKIGVAAGKHLPSLESIPFTGSVDVSFITIYILYIHIYAHILTYIYIYYIQPLNMYIHIYIYILPSKLTLHTKEAIGHDA